MAKLNEYEVTISGITHTLQLSAEDAENIPGAKLKGSTEAKQASAPANKSGTANSK